MDKEIKTDLDLISKNVQDTMHRFENEPYIPERIKRTADLLRAYAIILDDYCSVISQEKQL